MVPAASPRSLTPHVTLRQKARHGLPVDPGMLAKDLINAKLAFETDEMQKLYKETSDTVFWNCVDRYVRQCPSIHAHKPGVTLVLTHSLGSLRQIWEPTILEMITLARTFELDIDEIWTFEAVQHGDSALLNDKNLRDVFDWHDHCRDILNFLLHYMPPDAYSGPVPMCLPAARKADQTLRRVIGIGHSFGGTTMVRAAEDMPQLFDKVIVVEPMIVPPTYHGGKSFELLVQSSLIKPMLYQSKESAQQYFAKRNPTKRWHPTVLNTFIDKGLTTSEPDISIRSSTDQRVRPKTLPFDEAVVYCEWNVCYEAWIGLRDLDPRISLHWIMSGQTAIITGGENLTRETVWRRNKNTSNVRIPKAGHLIVQEAPKELAMEIVHYLKEVPSVKL